MTCYRIDVAYGSTWRLLLDDGTHRVWQALDETIGRPLRSFRMTGSEEWGEIIVPAPRDWTTLWQAYKTAGGGMVAPEARVKEVGPRAGR